VPFRQKIGNLQRVTGTETLQDYRKGSRSLRAAKPGREPSVDTLDTLIAESRTPRP
jgi:hypothetical protein